MGKVIVILFIMGLCILVALSVAPVLTSLQGEIAKASMEQNVQSTAAANDTTLSSGEALQLANDIMEHDEDMADKIVDVARSGDTAQAIDSLAEGLGNAVCLVGLVGILLLGFVIVLRGKSQ